MKNMRCWLIIATLLILIGCVIFAGVMTMFKWDFTKFQTTKFETNNYQITEDYKNISIIADVADIVFVPSETLKSSVVCYEQKNARHSVKVNNGTLEIEIVDTRKWYEHIGINFGTPKITVCIPQGEYGALSVKSSTGDVKIPEDFNFKSINISESTGDVTNGASALEEIKIKTSTGDICVENVSAGAIQLSVTTGKVTAESITCAGDFEVNVSTGKADLSNIACKNVISSGSTGDIRLKNVVAAEAFSIKRSTGDIRLDGCDASELFIETDTGDVSGSLLTEKVFITKADTGDVDVPKTITGGKCEIITDTGDIKIKIQ